MKWSIHWPHSLLYWSFNLTSRYFIASPGFVNVFSISTWSFNLTIWTFKPIATPTRYFYLKATLKVSQIQWPHQMHWNTLGVFCFCHTIVLYSEAWSSGRGFNFLASLNCIILIVKPHQEPAYHFLTSPENSTFNNLINRNRSKFVNLTKLHHTHFLTSPKTSISFEPRQ